MNVSSLNIQQTLFTDRSTLTAHAFFLGERIDLSALEKGDRLATDPLLISAEPNGCAVLLPYGAVVLFGLTTEAETAFLAELAPLIGSLFAVPETEKAHLHLDVAGRERVKEGGISLNEFSIERLQIVAHILAKSVVLAYYEKNLAAVFDQIEPFAAKLQSESWGRQQGRELLRHLGSSLLVQHKIVGRVEIVDKPELLWESPRLESFYLRLEEEYEIRERHKALERKLELISRTAETVLQLMDHRTSLRVEWYVVVLIVVEILVSLYSLI